MQRQGAFHLVFFALFFSTGAAALGAAVLCDDFVRYCRNQHLLREAQFSLLRLELLNAEYDALLEQLERDPNLLKRIAPVALGTRPADPNTAHPKARAAELAVARKALMDRQRKLETRNAQLEAGQAGPWIPAWLRRCSEPARRILLFISGAGLILISLVCFTASPVPEN